MQNTFEGPFQNWLNADGSCDGYHNTKILDKVLKTSLEVQSGKFSFQRDSVGFKKPFYEWPLLATILRESLAKKGTVHVMDFGGSLGCTYFQHLPLLTNCDLMWSVVEQKHFVEVGKNNFQSDSLRFYDSIDECTSYSKVDVVILSGVLQYLEFPDQIIHKILDLGANKIIIDKTIVNKSDLNMIYIQRVPKEIYSASYPCHFFSEEWLLRKFFQRYHLTADFKSLSFPEVEKMGSQFKGYVMEIRKDYKSIDRRLSRE